jgi:hypothetical protein
MTELKAVDRSAQRTNNDAEPGEEPQARRVSEFDGDPLSWQVDGEVGLWDMCIVFNVEEQPSAEKVRF